MGSRKRFVASHVRVAQGTGGMSEGAGRNQVIRMTQQAMQLVVREVAKAKQCQNYSIRRSMAGPWKNRILMARPTVRPL
jgi:hypothetical protein